MLITLRKLIGTFTASTFRRRSTFSMFMKNLAIWLLNLIPLIPLTFHPCHLSTSRPVRIQTMKMTQPRRATLRFQKCLALRQQSMAWSRTRLRHIPLQIRITTLQIRVTRLTLQITSATWVKTLLLNTRLTTRRLPSSTLTTTTRRTRPWTPSRLAARRMPSLATLPPRTFKPTRILATR